MNSIDWTVELKTLAVFVVWLFVVTPIFTILHQRLLFTKSNNSLRHANPLGWFWEFWKVLGLRSKERYSLASRFIIQTLILFSILLSTYILAALPLTNSVINNRILAQTSSSEFSLFFIISLLFLLGFMYTAIGFSLKSGLIQLTTLEQFITRQGFILIIAFACFSTFAVHDSKTLSTIALNQTKVIGSNIPSWGAVLNPIAFIIAIIALAYYTRQWIENETVVVGNLRKSIEAKLNSTLLVTFKIARSIEFLAIYALLTTLFLAGPFFDNYEATPIISLLIFTAKLLFLVGLVIVCNRLLPSIQEERILRLMLLTLLPLIFLSYYISSNLTTIIQ